VCHSEGASAASKIVSRFSNVFAGTATLSCTYLDSSGCAGRWGRWGARKGFGYKLCASTIVAIVLL